MAANIDVKAYAELARREVMTVYGTLKDKGANRFSRALSISLVLVVASYLAYLLPQKRSARLQAEIARVKLMSTYVGQYKDLRDQLGISYAMLPGEADRQQWLTNSVRESLNVAGLVTEEFRPVREQEASGLIYQTTSVSLSMRFSEFYDWLLRLETAKPLMILQNFEMSKKVQNAGFNSVSLDVATVIPKKRFQ